MKMSYRFLLMGFGMGALLFGLWTGWLRQGWRLPFFQGAWPIIHGPLMVGGFLGTIIGLERAVAIKKRWAFLAPAFTALGALFLLVAPLSFAGPLLIAVGSLALGIVFIKIVQRQLAQFTIIMGLGALLWLIGNMLWLLGWPLYDVVYWWMGFLALTIAGERLELSRLLRLTLWAQTSFLSSVVVLCAGLIGTTFQPDLGVRAFGGGLLALTLWLLRYDIAWRTVRKAGLTRFVAVCLLSGYVWLGVSGVLGLFLGHTVAGPHYDAMLHALFVGFVFSMIFGHAPIIFPGVLGIPVPFRTRFYGHWALLHLTVLLRVLADVFGRGGPGWRWGGLFNGIAILLFLGNTMSSAWQARK